MNPSLDDIPGTSEESEGSILWRYLLSKQKGQNIATNKERGNKGLQNQIELASSIGDSGKSKRLLLIERAAQLKYPHMTSLPEISATIWLFFKTTTCGEFLIINFLMY